MKGTTGRTLLAVIFIIAVIVGVFLALRYRTVEAPTGTNTDTESVVSLPATNPCGLTITSPLPSSTVDQTFTLSGTIDMSQDLACRWIVFEGNAGSIQMIDPETGSAIVPIQPFAPLPMDWMETALAGGTIPFAIPLSLPSSYTGPVTILLTEEDPSGEAATVDTLMLNVMVQ